MADNIKISEGSGPKVATDEITIDGASAHVQRVKPVVGAAGSGADVSSSNPMPVDDDASQVLLSAIKALLEGTAVVKVTDNAGSLTVDGSVSVGSALPAGSNAIGKLAANSGVDIGDVDVPAITGSTLAHGEADGSTKPHKIGGRARTALPAAEAQDDRVDAVFDKFGRQLRTTAPLDQRVSGSIDLADTTTTDVIAAPGASIAIVVTDIEVSNGDATVGTFVEVFDDATKKWKGYAGPLGGGFSQHNADGLFVCTANKAVRARCLTTSSETSVSVSGYKIPA